MSKSQRVRVTGLGLFMGLLLCATRVACAAPTLTGLIEFSTDSAGNHVGGQLWNTLGNDIRNVYNLYMTQNGIDGPFLNHGDAALANISIPLNVGTSTFTIYGAPGAALNFFGLNLFFNVDNVNPAISVFAPLAVAPSPYPSFAANSGATLDLQGFGTPGAGAVAYNDGSFRVTLTDYHWSHPDTGARDRIQPFIDAPDSVNDFVGQFTLVTQAVPEPRSLMLAAFGFAGLLVGRWRWKISRVAAA